MYYKVSFYNRMLQKLPILRRAIFAQRSRTNVEGRQSRLINLISNHIFVFTSFPVIYIRFFSSPFPMSIYVILFCIKTLINNNNFFFFSLRLCEYQNVLCLGAIRSVWCSYATRCGYQRSRYLRPGNRHAK